MNKKKLSVVMAGAMLATSVAPVLAAPVEMGTSQKKLVEKEVLDLVNSKLISGNEVIGGTTGTDATDFVSADVAAIMKKAREAEAADSALSAYGIKVLNKDGKAIDLTATGNVFAATKTEASKDLTYDVADIKAILTDKDLKEDMTVQVVERGTSTFLGQIIPGMEIKSTGVAEGDKFKSADFVSLEELAKAMDGLTLNATNAKTDSITTSVAGTAKGANYIESVKLNDARTAATITLKAFKNLANESEGHRTIEIAVGSPKLNFNLPVDAEGENAKLLTDSTKDVMNCVGFIAKETYQPSTKIVGEPKVKAEYKLVDDSKKYEEETLLASDLYDGFALTAKGTEIKTDILNAAKVSTETGKMTTVELSATQPTLTNGVASFTVTYFASHKDNDPANTNDKPSKVITVKSTNEKEIKSLYNMLKEKSTFSVGIVGGANRYETAVNVAKHQGLTEIADGNADNVDNNDIVLVNGESLVDGLAAAPLAATLKWNTNKGTAVLLSKADSLPKETKDFLEGLVVNVPKSKLKNVKIHLVGGEAVLSESLVEELKGMGFSVERYGGDNREETSLEVANKVDSSKAKGAFIVGGNGEADAMSIASVAVENETPIIVSNVHGLTKDALKYVKSKHDKDITVIGGESVVSAEEYAKLDALTDDDKAVVRVAGSNRFETNAKVIEKFYTTGGIVNTKGVILVKDGVADKRELIDALSAANYAGTLNAPIVLASTSLKDVQKNALLNVSMDSTVPKTAGTIAQVGIGAERTVLETIAGLFGISNVK